MVLFSFPIVYNKSMGKFKYILFSDQVYLIDYVDYDGKKNTLEVLGSELLQAFIKNNIDKETEEE